MRSPYILFAITVFVLNGCGKPSVQCGDSTVQDSAVEIFRNTVIEQARAPYTMAKRLSTIPVGDDVMLEGEAQVIEPIKNATMTLDGIRTTASNEENGAKQCAARITINGNKTVDITYKVEITDKGDQFLVTLLSGI